VLESPELSSLLVKVAVHRSQREAINPAVFPVFPDDLRSAGTFLGDPFPGRPPAVRLRYRESPEKVTARRVPSSIILILGGETPSAFRQLDFFGECPRVLPVIGTIRGGERGTSRTAVLTGS